MCMIPFGREFDAPGRSAVGRHIQLRAAGAARSGGLSAAAIRDLVDAALKDLSRDFARLTPDCCFSDRSNLG
jgi:hypothetical protein